MSGFVYGQFDQGEISNWGKLEPTNQRIVQWILRYIAMSEI